MESLKRRIVRTKISLLESLSHRFMKDRGTMSQRNLFNNLLRAFVQSYQQAEVRVLAALIAHLPVDFGWRYDNGQAHLPKSKMMYSIMRCLELKDQSTSREQNNTEREQVARKIPDLALVSPPRRVSTKWWAKSKVGPGKDQFNKASSCSLWLSKGQDP